MNILKEWNKVYTRKNNSKPGELILNKGDEKALAQWRRFRDMSIQSYASIYKRLNIVFDVYSGESQVNDYIPKVHALLEQKGLLTHTPEGAVAVNLEEYNLGQAVVKRSDGTTLYLTRDLANILMRKELYKDYEKAFYVVGTEQQGYFKQVFKIAQLMLDDAPQLEHIGFGRVKGMSTRKGTVIFLQDILDTAKDKILDYMKQSETKNLIQGIDEVADQLGVSGILVRDMKAKRIKDYVFDWDSMMDTKGDTGVFLQYAHARACG
jgi:arginyl-tRNA synthetase